MGFSEFIRTDLASESGGCRDKVKTEKHRINGIEVTRTVFDKAAGGFVAGSYYTLDTGELWNLGRDALNAAQAAVSKVLEELLAPYMPKSGGSVTVVCLGNRRITSDALGPLVSERLIVTRHIKECDPELFSALGGRACSVICPGVTGDTGIEAFDIIHSTVGDIRPDIIICIDALASKSLDRLASTVQLSNVGIAPGSGIGNKRSEISERTLGIPVISIGVPTVVSSSTLVVEALEKAGISELSGSLRTVLETGKSYFVSLKDADSAVLSAAEVIAKAINSALLGIAEL